LSHPGFEPLREFVSHEIKLMTSKYAQAFFKPNKEAQASRSKSYHVRFVTVGPQSDAQIKTTSKPSNRVTHCTENNATSTDKPGLTSKRHSGKPPLTCFVCD